MTVIIKPSVAHGEVIAPPSKSETHRSLICAALADGESVIENFSLSDDISSTLRCLTSLGTKTEICGDRIKIIGGFKKNSLLDCGESGSTLRFLSPVLVKKYGKAEFVLHGTLINRPLSVYETLPGLNVCRNENYVRISGELHDEYTVRGDISSQFISGLMLAGVKEINICPKAESFPYIGITAYVMEKFGVKTVYSPEKVTVCGEKYHPCRYVIGSDSSNAAYLYAFNAVKGNGVKVLCHSETGICGDDVFAELIEKLKAGYTEINVSDTPDISPILFVCASLLNGGKFTGTERLRYKESDRITSMKLELEKFGVIMTETENSVVVEKSRLHAPLCDLDSHHDHRIAMALTLIMSVYGGKMINAESVNKSFPDFYNKISSLGIEVTQI